MNKVLAALVCMLILLLIGFGIFFSATPVGRAVWNTWFFSVQKADDATLYDTRKSVEDTCRAMIASYTADKLTYEQYKASDNAEKQGWAERAKMRANKTAASYNEYILKNSFVWNGNVPADIRMNLSYLDD